MTQITLEKDLKWIKCQQSEVVSPWISSKTRVLFDIVVPSKFFATIYWLTIKPLHVDLVSLNSRGFNIMADENRRKKFNVAVCVEMPTRIYQGTRACDYCQFRLTVSTGPGKPEVKEKMLDVHGSTWRLYSSRTAEASVGRVCYHDCFFLRDPR